MSTDVQTPFLRSSGWGCGTVGQGSTEVPLRRSALSVCPLGGLAGAHEYLISNWRGVFQGSPQGQGHLGQRSLLCLTEKAPWTPTPCGGGASSLSRTANLRTKILDSRGFDSSRILTSRGGILTSIWESPGLFESTNLSGDNLSREIGRTLDAGGKHAAPGPAQRGVAPGTLVAQECLWRLFGRTRA